MYLGVSIAILDDFFFSGITFFKRQILILRNNVEDGYPAAQEGLSFEKMVLGINGNIHTLNGISSMFHLSSYEINYFVSSMFMHYSEPHVMNYVDLKPLLFKNSSRIF